MDTLSLKLLKSAVSGDYAGIRRITKLFPLGDPKIFPPTYEGGVYAEEHRRIRTETGTEEIATVLLDSVQSQANRMELALLRAYDAKKVQFPLVQVDFATGGADPVLDEIGRITTLELPHRITDAMLRYSEYDGSPFRSSVKGTKLDNAKTTNATPIFELCPTALVFGFWDSAGPRGGLGAKVQRALVSEIVGYRAIPGVRPTSRIDPVVIVAPDIYSKVGGGWTADAEKAEKVDSQPIKYKRASELNLGNVTPSLTHEDKKSKKRVLNHGGVTIEWAEQTTVLSLAALRKLRFPVVEAEPSRQSEVDDAARTVLAALGLAAICSLDAEGFDLRSRCLLDGKPGALTFVGRGTTLEFKLTEAESYELLAAAVKEATRLKLPWPLDPIKLKPSADLKGLVRKSREKSMATSDE